MGLVQCRRVRYAAARDDWTRPRAVAAPRAAPGRLQCVLQSPAAARGGQPVPRRPAERQRADVDAGDPPEPQDVLHEHGAAREGVVRAQRAEHDAVDLGHLDARVLAGPTQRLRPHDRWGILSRRVAALLDAGALPDPLVARREALREVVVRDDGGRHVVPGPENLARRVVPGHRLALLRRRDCGR